MSIEGVVNGAGIGVSLETIVRTPTAVICVPSTKGFGLVAAGARDDGHLAAGEEGVEATLVGRADDPEEAARERAGRQDLGHLEATGVGGAAREVETGDLLRSPR